jgi:hypothetical protein
MMSRRMISALSHVKLGLLAAGLILWGYGVRADVEWLRWAGIAFMAAAAILRFVRRDRRGQDSSGDSEPDSR